MRPRSTRIFVTIADEEMPRTPARTSASDVPQPSAKPKARPAPTFRARYVPPAMAIFRPPVLRCVHVELEPQVEEQEDESQRGEHLQVVRVREKGVCRGVCGPRRIPARMNRGIVGSPIRPPRRARTAAARKAPPMARRVSACPMSLILRGRVKCESRGHQESISN
ncbi:hypothetical protein SCALM49S_05663 [Streptomyces californicus]